MKNTKILMFHRIELTNNCKINELYYQRKMVCKIDELFSIIDGYINNGYKIGSIEQSINSEDYFHLSFDDGFKEHLEVAVLLKDKYGLDCNNASFAINVSNSINNQYTGMDIVYEAIKQGKINQLCNYCKLDNNCDIKAIKTVLAKLKPNKLLELGEQFGDVSNALYKTFLNKSEIIELSKLFEITSHGMTHRFLTSHQKESRYEIIKSKIVLENLIKKRINIFCYPEGKNDKAIQKHCKDAGYMYALSITHEQDNNHCVGRIIM